MAVIEIRKAISRDDKRDARTFLIDNFIGTSDILGCLPATAEQTTNQIMGAKEFISIRNSEGTIVAAHALTTRVRDGVPHARWFVFAVEKSVYNAALREFMAHEMSAMLAPDGGTHSCAIPKLYEESHVAVWQSMECRRDVTVDPDVILSPDGSLEYVNVRATYVPDAAADARLVELRDLIAAAPDAGFIPGQVL